jgi:hypothetical protein
LRAALVAGVRPLDHVLAGFAEGEEDPVQVHPQHPAIGLGVELRERARAAADAGIGDHGVDPAHLVHGLGHAGHDLGLLGDIDPLGQDADAGFLQLGLGLGVVLGIGAPDHDVGARLGQRFGHAEPDAAIAPGDQRHFAGQIEWRIGHGRRSLLSIVWEGQTGSGERRQGWKWGGGASACFDTPSRASLGPPARHDEDSGS